MINSFKLEIWTVQQRHNLILWQERIWLQTLTGLMLGKDLLLAICLKLTLLEKNFIAWSMGVKQRPEIVCCLFHREGGTSIKFRVLRIVYFWCFDFSNILNSLMMVCPLSDWIVTICLPYNCNVKIYQINFLHHWYKYLFMNLKECL